MYAAIHSIAHDCHHHLVDSVLYEVMVIILIVKNLHACFRAEQARLEVSSHVYKRCSKIQVPNFLF